MYFENDLLKGKQIANVNILTQIGNKIDWNNRNNNGLCKWYQIIYGKVNIKIFNVECKIINNQIMNK